MNTFYKTWIILKYYYYILYWKIKKPSKPNGLYGWQEINYSVLDQNAIAYGMIEKK